MSPYLIAINDHSEEVMGLEGQGTQSSRIRMMKSYVKQKQWHEGAFREFSLDLKYLPGTFDQIDEV